MTEMAFARTAAGKSFRPVPSSLHFQGVRDASFRHCLRGLASVDAKWQALVGDLHRYVSWNLRTVLLLAVEHAEEMRTTDNQDVVRPLDDAREILLVGLGVLAINKDLVDGEVAVLAFAVDESGPIEGRCLWRLWLVTLAALACQLEEHFGRPGRGRLR
jgi:hypothetical protein